MDSISTTTRIRQRRKRAGSTRLGSFALGCGVLLSLAIALASISTVAIYRNITTDLPSPELLPALLAPPNGLLLEPTRFYDRTGTHEIFSLSHPEADGAAYLQTDPSQPVHLPTELITTTLIASDPSTWNEQTQGDNTTAVAYERLANRLVHTLMLPGEPTGWQRDLRERLLTNQIQDLYGHEQIIEWYLNSVDYGNLAFGADAAARVYFGKPASKLSLAEAAVLAAVSEAPSLNPLDTPDEAWARGRAILRRGLERGLIRTAEFRPAINAEPEYNLAEVKQPQPFYAFNELVRGQLEAELGRDQLLRGGFRVRTTLDYDLQIQVHCAVQTQLARLGQAGSPQAADPDSTCEISRLIPALDPATSESYRAPAGSAIVMDPKTGEVLALAGSSSSGSSSGGFGGRPPGTLLTPYIHLAAYTRGLSPASLAWDIPASLPESLGDINLEELQHQGPVRLRTALVNDYLTPSLQLVEQIGPDKIWSSLPQLGFSSTDLNPDNAGYGLLLGDGSVTLLDVVHGYSAFSNLGLLIGEEAAQSEPGGQAADIQPVTVLQIEDANGNLRQGSRDRASRPIISSQLAYLITHSLSDEGARWESMGHPNLLEVGRPAGAKIGQTLDGEDIWTVGFTPDRVVGVWFGETQPNEGQPIEPQPESADQPSAEIATGPWHAIMQYASAGLPPLGWELPPGVSEVEVCDPSGLLPTLICPRTVTEVFLDGNEPTQLDTLYRKYLVNRETGRLATVFTPPELIDEQVFLVIPPTAAEWASRSGVEAPPDDYDLIFAPSTSAEGVSLDSPSMFAYVRGNVQLIGTADGPGFEYYRLQAGQGLNPQSWIQIGEDSSSSVEAGRLGTWDTSGLSGLYAVQLQVVRDDQRVDKITLQVTVDNTPPVVEILSPADGQEFSYPNDRSTTVQIQVSDNLALEKLELELDGRLFATLVEPPYIMPIPLTRGSHTIRATAYDRAGNHASKQITIKVD